MWPWAADLRRRRWPWPCSSGTSSIPVACRLARGTAVAAGRVPGAHHRPRTVPARLRKGTSTNGSRNKPVGATARPGGRVAVARLGERMAAVGGHGRGQARPDGGWSRLQRGSKTAIIRTSMLRRGGVSSSEDGMSNEVWGQSVERPTRVSSCFMSNSSCVAMRGT